MTFINSTLNGFIEFYQKIHEEFKSLAFWDFQTNQNLIQQITHEKEIEEFKSLAYWDFQTI